MTFNGCWSSQRLWLYENTFNSEKKAVFVKLQPSVEVSKSIVLSYAVFYFYRFQASTSRFATLNNFQDPKFMFLVKPVTKLKEPSIWIAISAKEMDTLSYYFQHGVYLTKQYLHFVKE